MKKEWTYRQAYSNGEPCGFVVQDGPANPICDVATEALAKTIAAAPQMYRACEAADVAFAVLQISDLTPQARGCVREAWPLIQEALAAAKPGGVYAEVIKDAHQHEIKRLDGIVADLQAEANRLGEKLNDANRTIERMQRALDAKPDSLDFGGMDPECYYAKACGHEIGGCQLCKERRQVVGGIYYSDEIGQPDSHTEA